MRHSTVPAKVVFEAVWQQLHVQFACTYRYNYFKVLMRDGTLIQANSADTYQQDVDG